MIDLCFDVLNDWGQWERGYRCAGSQPGANLAGSEVFVAWHCMLGVIHEKEYGPVVFRRLLHHIGQGLPLRPWARRGWLSGDQPPVTQSLQEFWFSNSRWPGQDRLANRPWTGFQPVAAGRRFDAQIVKLVMILNHDSEVVRLILLLRSAWGHFNGAMVGGSGSRLMLGTSMMCDVFEKVLKGSSVHVDTSTTVSVPLSYVQNDHLWHELWTWT